MKLLKKIWVWLICSIIILIAGYILISAIMMNNVKENVIQQNSDVEYIHHINRIGSWGEWFSEYVLIVERNGQKYRIWTTGDGKITDQEALSSK